MASDVGLKQVGQLLVPCRVGSHQHGQNKTNAEELGTDKEPQNICTWFLGLKLPLWGESLHSSLNKTVKQRTAAPCLSSNGLATQNSTNSTP